ncbi:MAG: hypothetical protein KGL39_04010 [Patescibacteria group bacterium]|nr:hypothetical protein [Patescibacteria group bacterium]
MASAAETAAAEIQGLFGLTAEQRDQLATYLETNWRVGFRTDPFNTMFPFRALEVNDSFFVPKEYGKSLAQLAVRHRKGLGRGFTVRRVTENGVDGYRVWRTA